MRSAPSSSSSSSIAEGQVRIVVEQIVLAVLAAAGLDRALIAGHEVTEDFLGDEEAVLQLGDGVRGRREQDDVVRALAEPIDRIGEATAAPRGHLDDLPARGRDLAGRAVDDRLAAIVRDVRPDHEHEFVSAHARSNSFQWGCPVDVGRADRHGAERKRARSLARAPAAPVPALALYAQVQTAQRLHPVDPVDALHRGGPVPASTILVHETARPRRPPSPSRRS